MFKKVGILAFFNRVSDLFQSFRVTRMVTDIEMIMQDSAHTVADFRNISSYPHPYNFCKFDIKNIVNLFLGRKINKVFF